MDVDSIRQLACVLLVTAALGGAWDFLYLHLYVQKLHAHPETRREHRLHTTQTALATPLVVGLFCVDASGALLWLVVSLFAATLVVELQDIWCERQSRRLLGGLSSGEYALHVFVSGIRLCAVTLILSVKPAHYWNVASTAPALQPAWVLLVGTATAAGGAVATVVHVIAASRGAQDVQHQAVSQR